MPTPPAVDCILDRLARLRARVRRILATAGVGRLLGWAAVLVAVWFLADLLLDLPLGVRRFVRLGLLDRPADLGAAAWLGLGLAATGLLVVTLRHGSPLAGVAAFAVAGVPGVLVLVAARHLVAPLRLPLPDDALALGIEAKFRRLEDRLAAALDFHRELGAPSRGESPAMMARVVEEADAEAATVEVAAVASARTARRAALAGVGATAAAAALLAALGADAALWARRALALEDVGWPRRTTLLAVTVDPDGTERAKDPSTPYVAALGQSLVVLARATGKVPSAVEIVDRVASGDERPLSHRMRPSTDHPGRFEHEFRDVRSDFTFTVRGGDDDDGEPAYRVLVRVPPRITGHRCDLVFPAYLGLSARRAEGGAVTVPEGTAVTVTFGADAPLARAEAVVGDAATPVERDGDAWRFRFEAQATTRYRIRIVTTDGRENDAAADTWDVTVEPDTPPRSEWVFPRGAASPTTAKGRIPLFLDTHDDHGVTDLRLEVLAGASDTPTTVPLAARTTAAPEAANDRGYGATDVLSYAEVEVGALRDATGKPLAVPTRVQVRAVARDAKGQEAAGPWTAVDVLHVDEVERGLAASRTRAKADVESVRADVKALEELLAHATATGALSDADRLALRDAMVRAGKARADLERAARAVGTVFTTWAYARLGPEVPTETVLALFRRHHLATFSRATDARSAAAAGAPREADDVFPWALFRAVVAARRDRVVFDTGVLDRMITVTDHVVEAAATRGPAAAEATARLAREPSDPALADARAAVAAWRASLDAASVALADWQSLAELTAFVRRLVEEQERVDKDLRSLDKGGSR